MTFGRSASTGELTFLQVIKDTTAGGSVDGLTGANAVVVSPDDEHVYVASLGDDAVAAFERSAIDGTLTFVEAEFGG